MARFIDYLKNIFFILVLLQIAPIFIKSIKNQYSEYFEKKSHVAVLPITDVLYNSDRYINNLIDFFKNKSIKAIVLKFNCPGGAAGTSQAIFNEIKELKKKYNKYVIAFVENLAASGGYYIATAADYIVTTPGAFIGSIGSYIAHPVFKDFIENYKIKYEVIKSGEYKTVGNPFLENTEAQNKMLQELSDNVYSQFTKDVALQRPKLSKNINEWANGKIFTGELAYKIGLVDELGSQMTVIKILREKAEIKGKIEWVYPKKKRSILQMLMPDEQDNDSQFNSNIIGKIYNIFKNNYINANY